MRERSYKRYLLLLLTVILTFNYVDRWAIGVALEDIKAELGLSDTQLGLLTGLSFAAFYSVMGIPIARWADRGNRVTIIALTTVVWSVAVALCSVAMSFVQLLLIRVAVAVGEAGCIPPAHSLIADHFDRRERPRAVAIYMLGVPASLTIGFFAAGWLNELYGWRVTFAVLGAPGLVLAALAWATLREPRKAMSGSTHSQEPAPAHAPSDEPGLRTVFTTLWANAAFRHLLVCFSVWYFFGYGLVQWTPAFFIRSHGLSTAELGTWLAVIYGVGGGVGVYVGGELAARYAARHERAQLYACAAAFSVFAALMAIVFLAADARVAFAALAVASLGGNMALGPMLATIQTLVPARMRAMSVALVYLFANLIGMGLGPLAAGAGSEALVPWFGEESLRYALVALCPGYLWAAWHLWRAGRTVAADMATLAATERTAQ